MRHYFVKNQFLVSPSDRQRLPRFALLFTIARVATLSAHSADSTPRPISTDRPDTTESAYTVPNAMFQIEASFLDFSRNRRGTSSAHSQWIFGQVNFKRGVSQNTDVQLIFNTHSVAGQVEGGDRTYSNGFGDITLRIKRNLWGNDEGKTAFALMPYLTFPTHTGMSDRAWAGGIILPFATTLPNGWSLGLMTELDFRDRAADGAGRFQWLHSATTGVPLTTDLSAYFELVSIASPTAPHQLSSNAGLTFQISPNLIIDTGCRVGLSRSSPDLGMFSGFSIRF
jgi:hypothetical protein